MPYVPLDKLFDQLKRTPEKKDKIKLLKEQLNQTVIGLLRIRFDVDLDLDITSEDVRWNPSSSEKDSTRLQRASKAWYVFLKSCNIPREKKVTKLNIMLEALPHSEAELFISALNGDLDFGLSAKEIKKALPTCIKTPKKDIPTTRLGRKPRPRPRIEQPAHPETEMVKGPNVEDMFDQSKPKNMGHGLFLDKNLKNE